MLHDIPWDLLLDIMKVLQVQDILTIRRTCKFLEGVTRSKDLWLNILHRDVVALGLPTPHYRRPLEELSSFECETLALHALNTNRQLSTWTDTTPCPLTIMHGPKSVTWVQLIHDHWLLVASSDQSSSLLSLWDIFSFHRAHSHPRIVAEVALCGPVKAGYVDCQDDDTVIALEVREEYSSSVIFLTLVSENGGPSFAHLATYTQASHLRAINGHLFGVGVYQELNIPTIINRMSERLIFLANAADPRGSAVAMSIHQDLIGLVTPRSIKCFSLVYEGGVPVRADLLLDQQIGYSVGFADARFIRPVAIGPPSLQLSICISGNHGIYLFASSEQELRSGALMHGIFSKKIPPHVDFMVDEKVAFMFCPSIDAYGSTSWFEGPNRSNGDDTPNITFRSTSHFIRPYRGARQPLTLDRLDLPSLSAMAVRDYDPGLGLAVFGNYYGELVLYNLGGCATWKIRTCLKEPYVRIVPQLNDGLFHPIIPVATSFGPPFPYCGPSKLPLDIPITLSQFWQSFPDIPHTFDRAWRSRADPDARYQWADFRPYLPNSLCSGMGWSLENAFHILGTPAPILYQPNETYDLVHIGGLLFVIWEMDLVYLVDPVVTPQGFVDIADAKQPLPLTKLNYDEVAYRWGRKWWMYWNIERRRGRNRWDEMRERGGDVHPSLLEDLDTE